MVLSGMGPANARAWVMTIVLRICVCLTRPKALPSTMISKCRLHLEESITTPEVTSPAVHIILGLGLIGLANRSRLKPIEAKPRMVFRHCAASVSVPPLLYVWVKPLSAYGGGGRLHRRFPGYPSRMTEMVRPRLPALRLGRSAFGFAPACR